MKTKYILITAVLSLNLFYALAQKYSVDINESKLTWVGEKVTGFHTGTVMFKSGYLEIDKNKLRSGNFVVDMQSITCTDIEDKETNSKLVNHLKSDDFFGVEKHPTSKFELLESSAIEKGRAKIKGNLTIKSITHPIEFIATMEELKNGAKRFNAKVEIDRSKYEVRYGSGSFFDNLGDQVIYDLFTLDLKIIVK